MAGRHRADRLSFYQDARRGAGSLQLNNNLAFTAAGPEAMMHIGIPAAIAGLILAGCCRFC